MLLQATRAKTHHGALSKLDEILENCNKQGREIIVVYLLDRNHNFLTFVGEDFEGKVKSFKFPCDMEAGLGLVHE